MFRIGRPVAVPLVLPVVLALIVWVHKESLANASWRSALLLSLPTVLLAIALPFLAFVLAIQFEDYLPKSLL
jgi:ABC-type Fe3+-siderophore transport system permease subunit